ncbi:hypothetical protein MNV49_000752 [Pseudohyphozyma bogoriensis]|nr:hypothetical protein MNV49_000752 [Pseudohyphozyma bogoriensis]
MSTWQRPADLESRPVAIIGGGFQGRRIALMWASQGRPVVVYDTQAGSLKATEEYFVEQSATWKLGPLSVTSELSRAVANAWLVIEAVPEILTLKRETFKRLEELAPQDAVLATNSSSYRSSEIAEAVQCKNRVCNIHYFRPPEILACEVMTSGQTDPALLEVLLEQLRIHGHQPFQVQKESTGFIHNRVWAAIKREALQVVAEGIAKPSDVDALFKIRFKTPQGPFEIMDGVGLDVVIHMNTHHEEIWSGKSNRNGIDSWVHSGGIAGRGVLLDWVRWRELTQPETPLPSPITTYAITLSDLIEVAKFQGTKFQPGDILIIRSGFVRWHNQATAADRKAATLEKDSFIGIEATEESKKWLWNEHFSAVVGDTVAFEAWPPVEGTTCLHEWLLAMWGCPIGEMWNLESLSELCHKNHRWSFFLASAPLNVPGGVGSPPNAIAIM